MGMLIVPTMVILVPIPSLLPSVPVFLKRCARKCLDTPRKVKKTLCKTVVDIDIIEDCKEVITTHCEQTSQKVAHHSSVVGHDSRVGPTEIVGSSSYGAVAARYGASTGGFARLGGYGRY